MKKISVAVGLILVAYVLVCGMSRPSKNAPVKQAVPEVVVPVEVKTPVASEIPLQHRGYFLTDLPKVLAEVIVPNDYVDILATISITTKDGSRQNATVTLLQNIKVLAVGTIDNKSYMVLALSPRDAQYLALTQKEGDISVILRAPSDATQYIMEISTFEKLFQ